MMYNMEYKQQYLNSIESQNVNANKTVGLLFRKIADYEDKLGKDLYNFSVAEIIKYYKSLCTPSLESLMIMNNQYLKYTARALSEDLVDDCQNHYSEITNVILSKCINLALADAKLIKRDDLLYILDNNLLNPSDKFLCLALFEGIGDKHNADFYDLTLDNFDIENKIIKLSSGRELEVSDKLISYAIESAETYDYYDIKEESESRMHYHEQDNRIVKVFFNSNLNAPIFNYRRSLYFRLVRIANATNMVSIGATTLKESGKLEYVINKANEENRSYMDILGDPEVVKRYGPTNSRTRYIIKYGLED